VDEAADMTGRSKSWIYQLIHHGRIQGGGVGAYWLEQSSVVRAFSKRRATA
jgi:excisionase family DNA binding protein